MNLRIYLFKYVGLGFRLGTFIRKEWFDDVAGCLAGVWGKRRVVTFSIYIGPIWIVGEAELWRTR